MSNKMRAMAVEKNGTKLVELPKPVPAPGEIRIKVINSAVNVGEQKVTAGSFVGRFLHRYTSPLVLGWDFAGIVDALGKGVSDLKEGMAVWGHLAYAIVQNQGAYAEYITVPRNQLAVKPDNVPFHIAAAAATVTMTSLQSLRDLGRLKQGDHALLIGAGGGIGKRLATNITGVCSTKDVEHVKSLGADTVIDRKKSNPLDAKNTYKVVFDTPAVYSFNECAANLKEGGAYITTLPNMALITGLAHAVFTSKRCYFVQVASRQADLELVGSWLSDGLEVPIDSRYKIANLDEALKRQTDRGRVGRVAVDVAEGWPS